MSRRVRNIRESAIAVLLSGIVGCSSGSQHLARQQETDIPVSAASITTKLDEQLGTPGPPLAAAVKNAKSSVPEVAADSPMFSTTQQRQAVASGDDTSEIQFVGFELKRPHDVFTAPNVSGAGTLELNGQSYAIVPLNDGDSGTRRGIGESPLRLSSLSRVSGPQDSLQQPQAGDKTNATVVSALPLLSDTHETSQVVSGENGMPVSLSDILGMVGGDTPAVGQAQWKVQEAYARVDAAEALKLPSIRAGFSYHRHDGQLQASNGSVTDVNRSSLQAGLGNGAVGAGTTPRHGIYAEFHLADAVFAPRIASRNAWAQQHAVNSVINDQLLEAATAYLALLRAEQESAILFESQTRTQEVAKLTADYAETGQGMQADADRMSAELSMVRIRQAAARERSLMASARLAEAISSQHHQHFLPAEQYVAPISLVSVDQSPQALISHALRHRSELKESQCLVAAACERLEKEKYAPLIPSLLMGVSQTGFGGDVGTSIDKYNDRFDFDTALTWELTNLGFGTQAAQKQASAQLEQARYRQVRQMDRIAREVSESHAQILSRLERIQIAETAVQSADDSFRRNMIRIKDGAGLPIEVLQSIRALEDARMEYVKVVSDFNESQFRLYRALGYSISAPAM